jgi:predicted nucleic acid-binding Zn ribbon protein
VVSKERAKTFKHYNYRRAAVLEENSEMNSADTFHKRLRDEIAAVEKEIQSHNQQVELLTQRLKGLQRAAELLESDQAAIAELLRAGVGDGSGTTREMATAPAATMQRATVSLKEMGAQSRSGAALKLAEAKCRPDARLRHDGSGSQAPSAADRPRVNRATRQGISLES